VVGGAVGLNTADASRRFTAICLAAIERLCQVRWNRIQARAASVICRDRQCRRMAI